MSNVCIHAGLLIDGNGNQATNQRVLVSNGKIEKIDDWNNDCPNDYVYVNCSNMTVMPGLINSHVHCLYPVGLSQMESEKLTLVDKILYGYLHAQQYLESGVTYVRSLGTENNYDLDLKAAINNGLIKGPHMMCSGMVITMTGGHGWTNGLQSDGVDECRKHTRELLRAGVDLVKIMATGGVMTPGVEPGSAQLTEEEMRASIEEAHKANRKTATHAQGTEGIKNALRAGIDSIEHGIFLDQECIDLMIKNGTYLVPTLAAPRCIVEAGLEKGLPDYVVRKAIFVEDGHIDSFKRAYAQGVKIAMGTDAGTPYNYHHNSAYELELMVKHGVTPMDALCFATHNSAECLGVLENHGTLEVGKCADILVLDGNPLENISDVRNVVRVYKAGDLVVEKA